MQSKVAYGDLIKDKPCFFDKQIGLIIHHGIQNGVGTFISTRFFLTAAQNLYTMPKNMLSEQIKATDLKVGLPLSRDKDMNIQMSTQLDVIRLDIHPQYDSKSFMNDIALLFVSSCMKNSLFLI